MRTKEGVGHEYQASITGFGHSEFETKANAEIDPDIRLEFLILAASYSRLADHADCNSKIDLVYETQPHGPRLR